MGRAQLATLLLLPILAGFLAFASFPRSAQGYLAWVAFVPLLFWIDKCSAVGRAFLGGFLFGLVQVGGLIIWIPAVMRNYGGVPGIGAWLLYALLVAMQAMFPATACGVTRFLMNRGGERLLISFPLWWLVLEFLEAHFPFGGFPWLLVGYSQTGYPLLMQIADMTGVYGISFLVVLANTALAWFLLRRPGGKGALWPLALTGLIVAMVLIYGYLSLKRWDKFPREHTAAMLQQNISIDESETTVDWKLREGYAKMADKLEPGGVDLLILPESPSPLSFQYDEDYRSLQRRLARRFTLGMIFNNISYREIGGGWQYFNCAYFLDHEGIERGRYDKMHLVPFGEFVPLKAIFFFVEAVSKDVSNFYPGGDYVTVSVGGHNVAAIICFEAVFPQLARQFARRGAELIVNLTNDSWYGDTAAPYQHLTMSRWRAVENRRFLLRATNSGISAVIEPSGRLQVCSGLLREDISIGRFSFVADQSFYTQYGDVSIFLCAIIITCIFVLHASREPHGS